MTNWEAYWVRRPTSFGEGEYLKQVELTVNGKPYSELEFQQVTSRIADRMALGEDDALLDVCCGNGVFTAELAKRCRQVVGIDFSEPLLQTANRVHRPDNVTYLRANALDIDFLRLERQKQFTKVLINRALQYFSTQELRPLLENLLKLSTDNVVIFACGIPNIGQKNRFFNSLKKKIRYVYYRLRRRDSLGTWWDESFIRKICADLGLRCEFYFLGESVDLSSQHYRFDVKISR
jgi:SAM-dependent methyltransferase